MSTAEIILADKPILPPISISPAALALRDQALAGASLIGKVENADENTKAVRAAIELKRIAQAFERQRKELKEPLLDAGRKLDRIVATELLDVNKELGRIENLTSGFQLAEQRRMREEAELQRKELERIEAERQAELWRIAREQEEIQRKAREAAEAAAKLAADAKNKKDREAARLAAEEARKQAVEAQKAAALAADESRRVQEAAQNAAMAEAKPITATRAVGQLVKTDWEITVINPYELAKFHPDCVKIEPLLTPIKQALNAGITVKGVRAEKKTVASVRVGQSAANLIEA